MDGILVGVGLVLIALAFVVLWRSAESGRTTEGRIAAVGALAVIGFITVLAGWARIDAANQKAREATATPHEEATRPASTENR